MRLESQYNCDNIWRSLKTLVTPHNIKSVGSSRTLCTSPNCTMLCGFLSASNWRRCCGCSGCRTGWLCRTPAHTLMGRTTILNVTPDTAPVAYRLVHEAGPKRYLPTTKAWGPPMLLESPYRPILLVGSPVAQTGPKRTPLLLTEAYWLCTNQRLSKGLGWT